MKRLVFLALTVVVTFACALHAAPSKIVASRAAISHGDESPLQLFRKYYNTYKETPLRVEAVLQLEAIEDPTIVDELAKLLDKGVEPEVVRAIVRVFASYKERPPVDQMLSLLKSEKSEAVRVGILSALAAGKYKDCTAGILPCLADKSWDVRRRALQAIVVQNDPAFAPQVVPLCDDKEVAVRCEALEALAGMKSDLVVPKAVVSLNDPVWQVRDSAIKALTLVRSKDAVEPLINRLVAEEGRLVPQIAEALANLTGKEYGEEAAKWVAWWAENKSSYVLPTLEAIAYLRGHREATTGDGKPVFRKSGVAGFTKIETPSRSIMFVIDVSGSMESEVTEKERFSDGNYPSYQRIDIVKAELIHTIDHLENYVNFNILAFATKVDPWKDKLVAANVLNKSAAKDWIKGLVAIGGSSKEDLASAGLVSSANLDQGKTNTYGALMAALNVKTGKKDGPRTGGVAPETKDYKVDVDTIFFLSDGRPTVGDFIDPDDILREVKNANDLRKVIIHTIAIGEFQKDFMKKIAEQNRGVFVDLGK